MIATGNRSGRGSSSHPHSASTCSRPTGAEPTGVQELEPRAAGPPLRHPHDRCLRAGTDAAGGHQDRLSAGAEGRSQTGQRVGGAMLEQSGAAVTGADRDDKVHIKILTHLTIVFM